MVSLADRRRGAEYLEGTFAVSERRACQVVGDRPQHEAPPVRPCIEEAKLVKPEIHELSERYPRFGYRKIFDRLKRVRAGAWGGSGFV